MPARDDLKTSVLTDGIANPNTPLLNRVIIANRLRDSFIRMILYGRNRVGKTTLACQFPKPLLLVSFEPSLTGGAMSIKKMDGVYFIHIKNIAEAHGLAMELRSDSIYKTIVLDSVSSMQGMVLKEICNWESMPVQANYGTVNGDQYRARSEQTREVIDLYFQLPKHIIVTAKEKDHNPPKEEKITRSGKLAPDMRPRFIRGMQLASFFAPEVGGATVEWLQDACDYIGRLYYDKEVITKEQETEVLGTKQKSIVTYETGKNIRCLRTTYHPNFAAGFRSPVPENVPEAILRPTFDKILKVMHGERLPPEDAVY